MLENQCPWRVFKCLSEEDKRQLFNDLLAVAEVYQQNKTVPFTPCEVRIHRRPIECRKRTLQYRNQHNDELVITQTHEQHLFKIVTISKSTSTLKNGLSFRGRALTSFRKECPTIPPSAGA